MGVTDEMVPIAELNPGDDWRIFGQQIVITNADCEPRVIRPQDFYKTADDWADTGKPKVTDAA